MFDLGGTSLTAMRLIATLEQRFGTVIPLSEFIAAPTVAAMADRLGSGAATPARFDPIVPLNPSGGRTPLFMVHPMGGNVLCFLPFAKHLDADQPLYALQAAGADPGTEPLDTIPDMARSYLAAVKRIQPEGPYKISGYSFGGFVAFEMALQLRAQGEQAEVLILDTVILNPDCASCTPMARCSAGSSGNCSGPYAAEPRPWRRYPSTPPRWTRSSHISHGAPSTWVCCPPTARGPSSGASSASTGRTGWPRWTTGRAPTTRTSSCCGPTNRSPRSSKPCTAPRAACTTNPPTAGSG
ncbi:non-ribosomal peptide synthetase [Streptomyces sp. FXJ1.4098]|nr:non-ribosomal peptide synthetase [Streptomyces sp. FXJ1.4098]